MQQVNFDNQASQVLKIRPLNITVLPKNYKRYKFSKLIFLNCK